MFNIQNMIAELFHTEISSFQEILYSFNCSCLTKRESMPEAEEIIDFIAAIPAQDSIVLTLSADGDSIFISRDTAIWTDEYNSFIEDLYAEDVAVSVQIEKVIADGIISIYCYQAFMEFLGRTSIENHFLNFSKLLDNEKGYIQFKLLDVNGLYATDYVAFADDNIGWEITKERTARLANCDSATVFLNKSQYRVIPQDFEVKVNTRREVFGGLDTIFGKLKRVLSYIYIANTSSIQHGKAVLQFDPANTGEEYSLEQLSENDVVAEIYNWIFSDDNCIDKAAIARKIVNVYCRKATDYLNLEDRVFNSIKSDFQIYQKNHVEQYIDMKNKISENIVESTKQIQELTHEFSDALRNNYVAILIFIMTVLFTETIDLKELLEKSISLNITIVCGVFTVVTLLYMIISVVNANNKWTWIKEAYGDLKANYDGFFDEQDLKEAFRNDAAFNRSRDHFVKFRLIVIGLWSFAVIIMGVFTGILAHQSGIPIQEESAINSDISEDEEPGKEDIEIQSSDVVPVESDIEKVDAEIDLHPADPDVYEENITSNKEKTEKQGINIKYEEP